MCLIFLPTCKAVLTTGYTPRAGAVRPASSRRCAQGEWLVLASCPPAFSPSTEVLTLSPKIILLGSLLPEFSWPPLRSLYPVLCPWVRQGPKTPGLSEKSRCPGPRSVAEEARAVSCVPTARPPTGTPALASDQAAFPGEWGPGWESAVLCVPGWGGHAGSKGQEAGTQPARPGHRLPSVLCPPPSPSPAASSVCTPTWAPKPEGGIPLPCQTGAAPRTTSVLPSPLMDVLPSHTPARLQGPQQAGR